MFQELYRLMKKEDLLHQSYHESAEMLQTNEQMFRETVALLRKSDDSELSMDIYAKDKTINAGERDIRRKILTHLTVAGNQSDVNAAFVIITIIHDMERIGDYCKNIYELAQKHPVHLDYGVNEAKVISVEETIIEAFEIFNKSFQETTKESSRDIMNHLNKSKKLIDELIDSFVDHAEEVDCDRKTLVTRVLYLRFIKRIAAHLNNIATSFVNPFDRIGFEE